MKNKPTGVIKKFLLLNSLVVVATAFLSACTAPKGSGDNQTSKDVVEIYEDHPERYQDDEVLAVALAYIDRGEWEPALKIYEEFKRKEPDDSRGWLGSGSTYLLLGRNAEAIQSFTQAVALGEDDALRLLAASHARNEDWTAVKKLSDQLVKYAIGKDEGNRERLDVIGLLMLSSACSDPFDKKLFDHCLSLLPKAANNWPEDLKTSTAATFQALGDKQSFDTLRSGINPGRIN